MSLGRLLILFFLASYGTAMAAGQHCFEKHIRDAIELNRDRRPVYKKWGGPKAAMLSRQLVLLEKIILPSAKSFDRQAIVWQEKGIPFLCSDLIDMKLTPAMAAAPAGDQLPPVSLKRQKAGKLLKISRQFIDNADWRGLFDHLEEEIITLHQNPQYHCLERHFIESVQRTAWLAPMYLEKLTESVEQKRFTTLLQKYLRYQLLGLRLARMMDQSASSLQAQGIPIFCGDVPAINTKPDGF